MTTQKGKTCKVFLSQALLCYAHAQISTVSLRVSVSMLASQVLPLELCVNRRYLHSAGLAAMETAALSPRVRDVLEYSLFKFAGL
jgi:hypothetical protein